jgi:hypothetical protein
MKSGLIVMGPTIGENMRIFQNYLIVMGVLPRAKMKSLKGTT